MLKSSLFAIAALTLTASPAVAWGPTGHRVTAKIASNHLSDAANIGVTTLLGVESMAEASAWPDFMRSNPSAFWRKGSPPLHYITVPPGTTYSVDQAPPEGDAVTALAKFAADVKDESLPLAERQLALRFVIHIVGDLHQPLHNGKGDDRGGNAVRVMFKDKPTNLHTVWDEDLIEDEVLSYTEKSRWLDRRITPQMVTDWSDANPQTWIAESIVMRDKIYKELGPYGYDTLPNLSYNYVYTHRPDIDLRLQQGGIRLATYLNELFGE